MPICKAKGKQKGSLNMLKLNKKGNNMQENEGQLYSTLGIIRLKSVACMFSRFTRMV
jgi:hypothetical protein